MPPLTRSFKELVQRRVAADPTFDKELIANLTEACEHAEGKLGPPVRVHAVEVHNKRAGPSRTPLALAKA
jgi:hypothetical protein